MMSFRALGRHLAGYDHIHRSTLRCGDPGPSTLAAARHRAQVRHASTFQAQRRAPGRHEAPPTQPFGRHPTFSSQPRIGWSERPGRASSPRSGPSPRSRFAMPGMPPRRGTPSAFEAGSMRRPPAPDRPTGYTGGLTRRNEPGLRYDDAEAFVLSTQLKEFVKRHPHPMKAVDVTNAIEMVRNAPPQAQNVVVWNQILHLLGMENKLHQMWKQFNDMKKRGIQPTTRTFAVMLNAFAKVQHDDVAAGFNPLEQPTNAKLQRVVEIYNQSQNYISEQIAKLQRDRAVGVGEEQSGLVTQSRPDGLKPSHKGKTVDEISIVPTNSYLKFLGKYGMWSQMDRIRLAMDQEGPLSPTRQTYSILFDALYHRYSQHKERRYSAPQGGSNAGGSTTKVSFGPKELGEAASVMWDSAVRQFYPLGKANKTDLDRSIDEEMATSALQCLLNGRPADQRLTLDLIPFLWNITLPVTGGPASMQGSMTMSPRSNPSIPPSMKAIGPIPITIRSATLLLSMLTKYENQAIAAKYARYFLNLPELQQRIDFHFIRVAALAFSRGGDVGGINQILRSYQPPSGTRPWSPQIWDSAFTACRYSREFDSAIDILRRMTHMPYGVEDAVSPSERKPYIWKRPNGKPSDALGRPWFKPDPATPDARMITTFLRTALSSDTSEQAINMRKAYNVLVTLNLGQLMTIPESEVKGRKFVNLLTTSPDQVVITKSLARAASIQLGLAATIRTVCENLLSETNQGAGPTEELRARMDEILKIWRPALNSQSNQAKQSNLAPTTASMSQNSQFNAIPRTMQRTEDPSQLIRSSKDASGVAEITGDWEDVSDLEFGTEKLYEDEATEENDEDMDYVPSSGARHRGPHGNRRRQYG